MNRQQAIHVLELIKGLYPRYTISREKAKMLIPTLMRMDYVRVRDNLEKYVAAYPYAPTIAEISAYPDEKSDQENQLSQWRKDAEQVSDEIKQSFQKKMAQLLEETSYDAD